MTSITFDSTEILNSEYSPRFIKHESAPDRDIGIGQLAREDGAVYVSDRYREKRIMVRGTLSADTSDELEAAIDSFKELFSREQKNLDIAWNGSTRRYVATCASHTFDRDHFHINFVPWEAEFVVPAGYGEDTSETTAYDDDVDFNLVNEYQNDVTFTLGGSAEPKPVIRLDTSEWGPDTDGDENGILGFSIEHLDTGGRVVVTHNDGYGEDQIWRIYCDEKRATTQQGVAPSNLTDEENLPFFGLLPEFIIGENNIRITTGGLANQQSLESTPAEIPNIDIHGTDGAAQSFRIPYTNDTFQGITLAIRKEGDPGDLIVNIETDDGGEPSGDVVNSPAADYRFTFNPANIGSSMAYHSAYGDNPQELQANTQYWIVLSAPSADQDNYYEVYNPTSGSAYPNGSLKIDDGGDWADATGSLAFKLLYGGIRPSSGSESWPLKVTYHKRFL